MYRFRVRFLTNRLHLHLKVEPEFSPLFPVTWSKFSWINTDANEMCTKQDRFTSLMVYCQNVQDLLKEQWIWKITPNFALPTGGPKRTEILRDNWLLIGTNSYIQTDIRNHTFWTFSHKLHKLQSKYNIFYHKSSFSCTFLWILVVIT